MCTLGERKVCLCQSAPVVDCNSDKLAAIVYPTVVSAQAHNMTLERVLLVSQYKCMGWTTLFATVVLFIVICRYQYIHTECNNKCVEE